MSVRFGMLLSPPMPALEKVIKIAQQAEDSGMFSLTVPDHTLMVPPGFTPNALSLLSALAVKTSKAMLGTGVTDVVRYHPSVLAQIMATIDHLSYGRAFLGLGAGEAMNIKPFGIEWKKPYTTLREGIEIIKRLWAGDRFSYEGKRFRLDDAFLQIKPLQKIPIYLGANGVKTRELAGEICDGWMPIAETPKTYRENLKDVERGCSKAGRNLDEIDTALQIYTAVDTSFERAMERARQFSGVIVSAAEKAEQAGYSLEMPEGISKKFYFEQLLLDDKMLMEFVKLSSLVTEEMIRDFFIVGTPEDCEEKIEEFVKAGVKHFMLINVGPDPKYVLKVYAERIIPAFSEIK
ncbi:LLM class flavin-dependent oxidoreductase [Archaeoglobus fulgidus]|jgi:alkanesulfonate monooxygenase SsuD/methylene tetrahydromethanopterin reductase-like flavin-dependent oxidoreductase (luciferase family)|uniref:5,10-methylenetetrahydromethanopterin reductase n=3 Tax=Archaeoglobus fulgidus TaxID=2234 RepID=O29071_ARCFU|nr:LLM class flavin-dependent oxidoreductase [Archaeoglobus fulgidus]AAB90050.1 N5,N10-methylenetetrahydromethanopterin reductase (mer-2) [Archaeoglobus fulgidus DSM 4304]AIG98070.1 Coenzyme F420-dependent N5,N10-methylene tetrahydromethanopterin reductase [Archaeoglobus fulgidus DSM 8774]KUJ93682.1 MAG: 5,10-methylenetetrahydromethanopterin reductase [Archaeoglobus fulgidus]KUK06127.1 MAG: 5,10-methylenetetrahydromethanopterin reductase [Archaeoglobus fulgidus]